MKSVANLIAIIILLLSGANTYALPKTSAEGASKNKKIELVSDVSEKSFDLAGYDQSTAPEFKLLELPDFINPDFNERSSHASSSSLRAVKLSWEIEVAFDASDIVYPFHTFL